MARTCLERCVQGLMLPVAYTLQRHGASRGRPRTLVEFAAPVIVQVKELGIGAVASRPHFDVSTTAELNNSIARSIIKQQALPGRSKLS